MAEEAEVEAEAEAEAEVAVAEVAEVVVEAEAVAEAVVAEAAAVAEVAAAEAGRSAAERRDVGAAAARPCRERRPAAIDLHVPDHRVRHAVLEPEPGRVARRDVVRVVDAPVGAGEDLRRVVRG